MKLVGANAAPSVIGIEELPGKANYFLGSDPAEWRTDIPTYRKVQYHNIYPGVDVVYYGNQRQVEYDFVVAPGVDPSIIRMSFQGADRLAMNDRGDLVISVGGDELLLHKPHIYQDVSGVKRAISGGFVLPSRLSGEERGEGTHQVGFKVDMHDTSKTLVIDPVLSYSTFLGGSDEDVGRGIAVDTSGNAYVTGYIWSSNFPTASASQSAFGGIRDAFVTKLNPSGSTLLYSTYLGGSDYDWGSNIIVDASGNAYVTGTTRSTNFPIMNPLQAINRGGNDAFITKLNSTGSVLLYSTYLGGSNSDWATGVAIDSSGSVYVTGYTSSIDFLLASPLQATTSDGVCPNDAFVTKVNAAGSGLVYSTYLGGSGGDSGYGIAVDSFGNAYVTGETFSLDFPTANPIQAVRGGTTSNADALVTKVNAAGTALVFSTYLGGRNNDTGRAIAVDAAGNAYVAGDTHSIDFPTASPFQTTYGGEESDVFIAKISDVLPCTFTILPSRQSFGAEGGTGSVGVTAPSGCSWTASSNASWLTVTGGSPGSGNGTATYAVAANGSPSSRTGTLTIAGQTVTVMQAGGTSFTLTVTKVGTGSWRVTSTPPGIDCPGDCIETYPAGQGVTLTAHHGDDSMFVGWGGDPDCADGAVTMTANRTCTATFNLKPSQTFTLTVTKAGRGSGLVTSTPPGISCPGDCGEVYSAGQPVTLTALAMTDSIFMGWSGDPDCADGAVTMTANRSCTATFNVKLPDLVPANKTPSQAQVTPPTQKSYQLQLRAVAQTSCESYNPDQPDPDLISRINPNKMTVVLTHGWNPDYPSFRTQRGNVAGSVSALCKRLVKHKYDTSANLLWWDWLDEATSKSPVDPAKEAPLCQHE